MSSRAKPFYGRKHTQRTVTGCLTCRRRRLKCDEIKPHCTRCTRADLECTYGVQLRWPAEGAKLGNNRVRQSRSARRSSDTEQTNNYRPELSPRNLPDLLGSNKQLSFNSDDISLLPLSETSGLSIPHNHSYLIGDTFTSDASLNYDESMFLFSEESFFFGTPLDCSAPGMDDDENMLYDFYANEMCPRCLVRNGDNNNYRQVVLPLVFQSRLIFSTVLAVAANRLQLQDSRFQAVALRYQNQALNGLQRSVAVKEPTWFSRIEVLSTILMLCFFEIYSPATGPTYLDGVPIRPWKAHADGARQLESSTCPDSRDTDYERAILSFLSQYFASKSILTYTAVAPTEDKNELLQASIHWLRSVDRPFDEINPFSGCSNELLELIMDITSHLRRRQRLWASSADYYRRWINKTRRHLHHIRQYPPAKSSSCLLDGLESANQAIHKPETVIEKTAEAFRFAALILLENTTDHTSDLTRSRTTDSINGIFNLLQSAGHIPPYGKLGSSSYIWPYFIAGCHMRDTRQQTVLLEHMARLTWTKDSGTWRRNTVLERFQDILVHVWELLEHRSATILVDETSESQCFIWETMCPAMYPGFEWV
ncbi:fungal-specific transcription factor domain-containing protein [Aspergillus karnatakaensis]|uniref:Zn(II)2Cys6 transcription factor n=1 Tax=Aspergillus karnatakaensis TaxID=1810916 RepID=UPI003CCD519B